MKKIYEKPSMRVVKIQHSGIICTSGTVTNVGGNSGMSIGGGKSGTARARGFDDWDDDCDEE